MNELQSRCHDGYLIAATTPSLWARTWCTTDLPELRAGSRFVLSRAGLTGRRPADDGAPADPRLAFPAARETPVQPRVELRGRGTIGSDSHCTLWYFGWRNNGGHRDGIGQRHPLDAPRRPGTRSGRQPMEQAS